jgi:hypothetical protein
MERRRQTKRYRLQIILFLPLIAALPSALAQQAATPTLDEILLRLEGNLNHYDKQVPNFFCNEHVVSSLTYGQKRQSTVTDSVFRVTRALPWFLAILGLDCWVEPYELANCYANC